MTISFDDWVEVLIKEKLHYPHYTQKSKVDLMIRWVTGGQSGGNCWDGDDGHHPISTEPEPEFVSLDKIIEKYWIDIPWLKYKRFCQDNIEISYDTDREYYGNYTEYTIKTIRLIKLYELFCENDKL